MSSKTSSSEKLFSKAIIKADLRNHWAWPVIAGVLMIFNLLTVLDTGSVVNYLDRDYGQHSWLFMVEKLIDEYYFTFFVGIVFSIFLASKLFFYLDKMNSVSCMHGFPFTRKKLFFSHILSGGILIMIPAAAVTAVMIVFGLFLPRSVLRPDICLMFLAAYAVYTFIAFAISIFTMTVTGNVIVSLAYSVCIIILPIAVVGFVEALCEASIYGYVSGGLVEQVFNYLYLIPENIFPWKFIIYIVLALGLYTVAYFVYKVRPLENCEEVMAFRKFRWFFIVLAGFVAGMISYVFFCGMLNGESVLWMLPLGIVGTVAASMFARKSVSLKGSLKYVVIYVLLAATCEASLTYDLFGYERFVPPTSLVESVCVEYDTRNYYYYEYDKEMPDYHIKSPEEIDAVRALHKAYISEKNSNTGYYGRVYYNSVYRDRNAKIVYKLKNGMTVRRRYTGISGENFDKCLKPVLDTHTVKSRKYPIIDGVEKEILNFTVYDDRINTPAVTYNSKEDIAKLEAALIYDIENNTYTQLHNKGALSVAVEFYVPGSRHYNGAYPGNLKEKYEVSTSFSININNNFTRTLAVLEEMGYEINSEKDMERIDELVLYLTESERTKYLNLEPESYDDYTLASLVTEIEVATKEIKEMGDIKVTVTDKDDIIEFYKLCGTGFIDDMDHTDSEKFIECSMIFSDTDLADGNGTVYNTGVTLIPEKLPESLKKYFK